MHCSIVCDSAFEYTFSHHYCAEPAEGIRDPPRVYGARASDKRIPSAGERPRARGSSSGKQQTAPLIIPSSAAQTAPLAPHRPKGRPRGSKSACKACGGAHNAGSQNCDVTKPVLIAAKQARKEQVAAARKQQQAPQAQKATGGGQNSQQQGRKKQSRAKTRSSSKGSQPTPNATKCRKTQPTAGSPGNTSTRQATTTTQQHSRSNTSHSQTGAGSSQSVGERPFTVVSHCPSQFQQGRRSAHTACSAISAVTLSAFLQHIGLLFRSDASLPQTHAQCIALGTDVYEGLRRDHAESMDDRGYFNCGVCLK